MTKIMNPGAFAWQLLHNLSEPTVKSNVEAIVAWQAQEGGHWRNAALYNPLNTTQPYGNDHAINKIGVKSYSSWEDGFAATKATLVLPYYKHIRDALNAKQPSSYILETITSSPWGTHFADTNAAHYWHYAAYGYHSSTTVYRPNQHSPEIEHGKRQLNFLGWPLIINDDYTMDFDRALKAFRKKYHVSGAYFDAPTRHGLEVACGW